MQFVNRGFTLIEVIVVILILGILAAAAIPKFVDLSSDARLSTIKSMAGAVSTGAMLARSKAIIVGADVTDGTGTVSVDLDGDNIDDVKLIYGYPDSHDSASMTWIIEDMGDFTYTAGATGIYRLTTNCEVEYVNAANANSAPQITIKTGGC